MIQHYIVTQALLFVALLTGCAATQTCRSNPSTQFFKLGNLTAQVTSDGPLIFPGNGFSVPTQAVKMSYELLYRAFDPVSWDQNVIIFRLDDGQAVLVDTGSTNIPVPGFEKAGRLLSNMRASGLEPEAITAVLLTHGHVDHASGLVDMDGKIVFPNARVFVPRVEHEFWGAEPFVNPSPTLDNGTASLISDVYKRSVAPYVTKGRLTLVKDGGMPLPGVKFRLFTGHAPGHAVIQVVSDGQRLVIVGDAWVSQPDQVRHPEWAFSSESNSTKAFLSRTRLMGELADSGDLVAAYHEVFPGLGRIVRTAYGFDWVPAPRHMMGTVSTVC